MAELHADGLVDSAADVSRRRLYDARGAGLRDAAERIAATWIETKAVVDDGDPGLRALYADHRKPPAGATSKAARGRRISGRNRYSTLPSPRPPSSA